MQVLRTLVSRRTTYIRQFTRSFVSKTNAQSTAVAVEATSDVIQPPSIQGSDLPPNPKLLNIVNEIAKLNLLEVSELSGLLKKTLNLPDAPVVSYAAQTGPAAPVEEEEAAAPQVIQTAFKVKLTSFDETKKIQLIKELKNLMEGMNLVQAKKFIESAPAYVKEDASKDEAEKLKEALEKVGAVIEVQ